MTAPGCIFIWSHLPVAVGSGACQLVNCLFFLHSMETDIFPTLFPNGTMSIGILRGQPVRFSGPDMERLK